MRVEPVFLVIVGAVRACATSTIGLDIVLIWVACSFVSILVHELGHGFALKVFGQPSVIVLHGFGGVTISQRRSALSRARSIVVSVAGSLTAHGPALAARPDLARSDAACEQHDDSSCRST